jgi:hypothetical protein
MKRHITRLLSREIEAAPFSGISTFRNVLNAVRFFDQVDDSPGEMVTIACYQKIRGVGSMNYKSHDG